MMFFCHVGFLPIDQPGGIKIDPIDSNNSDAATTMKRVKRFSCVTCEQLEKRGCTGQLIATPPFKRGDT